MGWLEGAKAADGDVPSGGNSLEEIVVTATRRAERLQDVAVSATAFTQEKLDIQGLRSIDDLTRLTPGVTFQRDATTAAGNFNDEDSDINIRGVDSTAGSSTVGIYIDDTPIQGRHISFTSFNAFPALFDLERVEVLRGPQGDRLPGAPWTFLTSAEYAFPAVASRKPYLRIDFQYTTAQTALQPIQDPNNGVADPTYTGLPETKNLSLRAGLRFSGILAFRAESHGPASRDVSHRRYDHVEIVLRPYDPTAHRRDHGHLSPLAEARGLAAQV